jgi:hypothetical protein
MGEANHNPMSHQFKGEPPDAMVGALTKVAFVPNQAWVEKFGPVLEEAKAKGENSPPLPWTDADKDVVIGIAWDYVIPSRLMSKHPRVVIPAGEIRMPFVELKKLVKAKLDEQNDSYLSSLVKLPDEAKSD